MWVEAILLKEDLVELVAQLLPVTIHFGSDDVGRLSLTEPRDATLIAGQGLRVVCKAHLHWPVLGSDVPVLLHSLDVLLRPEIAARENGPALVFTVEVEHADVAAVPTLIDNRITEKINRELAAKRVELTWDLAHTLGHVFALPPSLEPLDAIVLRVGAAKVKVSAEAIGLAALFEFAIERHGEGAGAASRQEKRARPTPPTLLPPPAVHRPAFSLRRNGALLGALGAVVAGGLYAVVRAAKRPHRLFGR